MFYKHQCNLIVNTGNGDVTMKEILEGIKGRKAKELVKDNVNVVSEPIVLEPTVERSLAEKIVLEPITEQVIVNGEALTEPTQDTNGSTSVMVIQRAEQDTNTPTEEIPESTNEGHESIEVAEEPPYMTINNNKVEFTTPLETAKRLGTVVIVEGVTTVGSFMVSLALVPHGPLVFLAGAGGIMAGAIAFAKLHDSLFNKDKEDLEESNSDLD